MPWRSRRSPPRSPAGPGSTSPSPTRSRSATTAATARAGTPARMRSTRSSPRATTTARGAPTSCCRRSTSAPRPRRHPQPLVVPAGAQRPSRGRSSAGPTGSPTAPTTSRMRCTPASSARRAAGRGGRDLRPDPARAAGHLRPGRRRDRRRRTARSGCRRSRPRALAAFRAFNYERIYVRPASLAQSRAVVDVLRALVEYYAESPARCPTPTRRRSPAPTKPCGPRSAYVAGMTDRYAFDTAVRELGWDPARLPQAVS